jgi:hypothetical protein
VLAGWAIPAIVVGMAKDCPEFWGVWTGGQKRLDLFTSEIAASKRAQKIARSIAGTSVHLMHVVPVGTLTLPPRELSSNGAEIELSAKPDKALALIRSSASTLGRKVQPRELRP